MDTEDYLGEPPRYELEPPGTRKTKRFVRALVRGGGSNVSGTLDFRRCLGDPEEEGFTFGWKPDRADKKQVSAYLRPYLPTELTLKVSLKRIGANGGYETVRATVTLSQ